MTDYPDTPTRRPHLGDERHRAIENTLRANEPSGSEWGEQALLGWDQATAAIDAILEMVRCHRSELAGYYAQKQLCEAIGIKAFTFSSDEAVAIDAHRKAGNFQPNGPFKSTIEAVRDRELIQQVGVELQSVFRSLSDADLVVTQQARRAGITTDLHRLRIALDALRLLSKRIEVLPFIDRES